jgi:hypothetical protein
MAHDPEFIEFEIVDPLSEEGLEILASDEFCQFVKMMVEAEEKKPKPPPETPNT